MSDFQPGPYRDYETLERVARQALANGRANGLHDTSAIASEMRMNRQANMQRTAVIGGGFNGSGISFATARPRDPMFYWRESNLPFEYTRDEEIIRLRQYARLVYLTDPVMASCIDVYSYWPLTGMHVEHKDQLIQDFYEELFFDENSGLNYEEFLPELLHEYWLAGEAFPLGHFNELLGIWEYDELINADDVKVVNSPFMREPRFEIKVPEDIRRIVTEREPRWEFAKLVQAYPEFLRLAQTEEFMPVSNDLMRQVAFKADKFHNRGLPIMMRAFRSLYQQEMLNAAMDSIASRLYTPLVLVRLGASAQDTGTDTAWVPTAQQLEEFQESLDIALAADFRVLTSHFATQVDLVFGREAMPDFGPDFDRLMDQKLLAFGLSRTMLMGAASGETYAADALNRDVVTQMLTRAQRHAKRHFAQRCALVAKAQEHYEVEKQGGRSKIVYQEVLVVDPDGNRRIERKPKLMQPKLVLDVLNLHDEQAERSFIEALVAQGIPISARTRLRGTEIDLDEELGKVKEEQVNRAVAAQETRKDLYLELKEKRLPIEQDLLDDFEPVPEQPPEPPMIDPLTGLPMDPMAAGVPGQDGDVGGNAAADQGTPLPSPAVAPGDMAPLTPLTPEEAEANPPAPVGAAGQAPIATPGPQIMVPLQAQRPPESDEQRKRMPRPVRGHAASNGHTGASNGTSHNGNGNGKLHWHFSGRLDQYLADWPWPHLGAVPLKPRRTHRDSMEPFLGNITRRLQAFHGDPRNKVEILDPNDSYDREKLRAHADRADEKFHAWNNEVYKRAKEGTSKGNEDDVTQGLDYMASALRGHEYEDRHMPKYRVAVATRTGRGGKRADVVGAMAFEHKPQGHLFVHMLGSEQGTYGTGTALEHAVARYGYDNDANGVQGSPSQSSEKYHQSIGRVITKGDVYKNSRWDKDDMEQVAQVPTHPMAHTGIAVNIGDRPFSGRTTHDDPIEPYLGKIQHRVRAFHADPDNKVEVLNPDSYKDRERLNGYRARTVDNYWGWRNEVDERKKNGTLNGNEKRVTDGLGYMKGALDPPRSALHRVAVATHKGDPVAAIHFEHSGGNNKLYVHLLGSSQGHYGAATAVQHAMAKWGRDNDADGVISEPTADSTPYHRSIGRVVNDWAATSAWDRQDMHKLAGLHAEPEAARA